MAVWRNTTYRDFIGAGSSPEEAVAADSGRVIRSFQVDWDKRLTAAQDFIGYPIHTDAGGFRFIQRVTPFRHPDMPWMVAQSIPRIEGIGTPDGGVMKDPATDVTVYRFAHLQTVFSAVRFFILEDEDVTFGGIPDEGAALATGWENSRYVMKEVQPGGRVIMLNRGLMRAAEAAIGGGAGFTDLGIIPEGIPFREVWSDLTFTWMDVPLESIPVNAIALSLGTVNDAEFDHHPAETLLLEAATYTFHVGPFGGMTADVKFSMRFLPNVDITVNPPIARGHNWVLKFVDGRMKFVKCRTAIDGGDTPYRSTSFPSLFRPDQP